MPTGKTVETLPAIVALSPSPDEGFNEDTLPLAHLATVQSCFRSTFQHTLIPSTVVSMSFHKFNLLTRLSGEIENVP